MNSPLDKKTKQQNKKHNMKTNKKRRKSKALLRIQKLFPKVKYIEDAKSGVIVSVNDSDNKQGKKKIASSCALAKACVRQKIADGAIINIGSSYLIRGDKAIRYKTSVGVSREITSFDRHQHFEPGKDYLLSPISPSNTLEAQKGYYKRAHRDYKKAKHITKNVRVATKDD